MRPATVIRDVRDYTGEIQKRLETISNLCTKMESILRTLLNPANSAFVHPMLYKMACDIAIDTGVELEHFEKLSYDAKLAELVKAIKRIDDLKQACRNLHQLNPCPAGVGIMISVGL